MEFLGILQVILLGIIEGITEWLPVSSTGHIILFNYFYPSKLSATFSDMFEYVVQLAAILAVVVFFWKKLFPIGKENTIENGNKLVWKKDVLSMWSISNKKDWGRIILLQSIGTFAPWMHITPR